MNGSQDRITDDGGLEANDSHQFTVNPDEEDEEDDTDAE